MAGLKGIEEGLLLPEEFVGGNPPIMHDSPNWRGTYLQSDFLKMFWWAHLLIPMSARQRSGVSIAWRLPTGIRKVLCWLLSNYSACVYMYLEPCSDFSEQGFFDEKLLFHAKNVAFLFESLPFYELKITYLGFIG